MIESDNEHSPEHEAPTSEDYIVSIDKSIFDWSASRLLERAEGMIILARFTDELVSRQMAELPTDRAQMN